MSKTSIAGLEVNTFTKNEFLSTIAGRLARGEKTFVITPYSEFLYAALRDRGVMDMFNRADIAIPDGIAILWAQRFLSIPFSVRFYYAKIFQALWQIIYSGAGILLHPRSVRRTFPEKITGADIVWDIAELAVKNNYSIYLLGGFGETTKKTAEFLKRKYTGLNIVGASNRNPGDEAEILPDLAEKRPDILLVAFGPIRQEQWITKHYGQISAKLIIGLGGTFDYIAGHKTAPPRFIRKAGLEWLHRLVTQPHRAGRIKHATWDLILALLRYKVFMSLPLRENVVSVIVNPENKIFVGRRNSQDSRKYFLNEPSLDNYWQMPQGGMEEKESITETSLREIREEIGTKNIEFITASTLSHTYIWDNAFRPLFANSYKKRGQHQQIVYLRYSGDGSDIHFNQEEFVDCKWVIVDDLVNAVHPQRQLVARMVVQDIRDRKILEKKA